MGHVHEHDVNDGNGAWVTAPFSGSRRSGTGRAVGNSALGYGAGTQAVIGHEAA